MKITKSLIITTFVAGNLLASSLTGHAQNATNSPPPPPSATGNSTGQPTRVRVGGNVQPPKLISAPPPVYPMLARQSRIQGDVVLNAVITKDGNVTDLSVISGHPLLVQAAEDAVRQWKYQTTLLNGEPVEVEITVTIHFALGENAPDQPPNP